ncbi:MAG: hypothetical protein AAF607_13450, partial [Pseudomonadota bacterium]
TARRAVVLANPMGLLKLCSAPALFIYFGAVFLFNHLGSSLIYDLSNPTFSMSRKCQPHWHLRKAGDKTFIYARRVQKSVPNLTLR